MRVDILERLADLIRPALAWREGVLGPKPPGAVAGGGFTVVNTMTSLTGASGEDFASILRALGYRMEQRPKPADPAAATTSPGAREEVGKLTGRRQAPPDDRPHEPPEEAAAPPEPGEGLPHSPLPASEEREIDAAAAPNVLSDAPLAPLDAQKPHAETAAAQEGQHVDTQSASSESLEAAAPTITSPHERGEVGEPTGRREAPPDNRLSEPGEGASTAPESTDSSSDPNPLPAKGESEIGAAATPSPSEPMLIEVWRPGRPEGRRRPRVRHREAGKHPAKGAGEPTRESGAPAAPAVPTQEAAGIPPTEQTAPAEPSKAERHSRHRRRQGGDQRFDRPRRERAPADAARHERHEQRHERREKAPDPNSPFAKLASLKAQLEAEAKERR